MSQEVDDKHPSAPPLDAGESDAIKMSHTLTNQCSLDSESVPTAPLANIDTSYVNPVTQVELTISANSLLNLDQLTRSDPLCVAFLQDSSTFEEWIELGRTEAITDNLNPQWKAKFLVDYRFEERQLLHLRVYDKDCIKYSLDNQDFLGNLDCTLGEVVSAPHSKFTGILKLPKIHATNERVSTITISAEEIGACKKFLRFRMLDSGTRELDKNSSKNKFVSIFKQVADSSWILLYRSEKIPLNQCEFPPVYLRYSSVCAGRNVEVPLRFQLHCDKRSFKGKCSQLMGEVITTYVEILGKCRGDEACKFNLESNIKGCKKMGSAGRVLEIRDFQEQVQKTLLDYLQDGLQLNFAVAIDFTASNGEITRHSSLHYKHGERDNPYVASLKILGEILQDYNLSKEFYAYGFGAKGFPQKTRVNHKFPLNFKESNPTCKGIDGILTAYYRALPRVKLSGPTCFAPIIREVTEFASAQLNLSEDNYFVLVILTDGIVCDPDTTRDALVEASFCPMSVIIIGVGDEDFTAMEKFDSDHELLKSRSGKVACRDIVQFVELKKYINFKSVLPITAGTKLALSRSVLAELPQQVVSWMRLRNE